MARTAEPARSNPFLVRCNLEPSTRLEEVAEPAALTPERSLRLVTDELLGIMGQAILRIRHRDRADAALRELWAALQELKAVVARDPGIRMAVEDLYAAAAAIVAGQSAGPERADVRYWRLLTDADARLRDRLASARPSGRTRHADLN
jgi:hypothetical protein